MVEQVLSLDVYLTFLSVLLLIGLFSAILSKKFNVSNVLILIFFGVALKLVWSLLLPTSFLVLLGLITLVMIVFNSTSSFTVKEVLRVSPNAFSLTLIFLPLNFIALTFATFYLFKVNWFVAAILASILTGTDPGIVLPMLKNVKNKIISLLEVESIINTPLTVILPFMIIDLSTNIQGNFLLSTFTDQIVPFLRQIIGGVGSGVVISIIMIGVMRKYYLETISQYSLIASSLLVYVLAQNTGGNGVLAVTVLGLTFGNLDVINKLSLERFMRVFTVLLEILLFIILGYLLIDSFPLNMNFITKSFLLFLIYLLVRFVSVYFVLRNLNIKQKIFSTLVAPKGIAVATVAFFISNKINLAGQQTILNVSVFFILATVIVSTVVVKFYPYLLDIKPTQKQEIITRELIKRKTKVNMKKGGKNVKRKK